MNTLTKHGAERGKSRCGLNKEALARMIPKVLACGVKHKEATGRLKKYLDYLWFGNQNGCTYHLYAEKVWVLAGEKLVTVFPVAQEHRAAARKLLKRKAANAESA